MKYLLLLFLFIVQIISSQEIKSGYYYNSKKDIGFESDLFQFKSNYKFNLFQFGCSGVEFGSGTYKIINDSLILKFDHCFNSKNQKEIITESSKSDSLNVNIKVLYSYDNENEALPGVNCDLKNLNIRLVSNFNGDIIGKLPKSNSTQFLTISYFGFGDQEIRIPSKSTNVSGIIYLDNIWFTKPNKILFIKILSQSNRKLKLARYKTKNIKYKRIKRKDALNMIKRRAKSVYESIYIE